MAANSKSTVAGHQGSWVPFSKLLVTDERWSGRVPSDAWRVLWWLNNRMTGSVKYENEPDIIHGVVAGGNTISYKDIASDLHCSWRSVQRSVEWLEQSALITRGRSGKGQEYRFNVLNSIRQFPLHEVPATGESQIEDEFNIEAEDNFA